MSLDEPHRVPAKGLAHGRGIERVIQRIAVAGAEQAAGSLNLERQEIRCGGHDNARRVRHRHRHADDILAIRYEGFAINCQLEAGGRTGGSLRMTGNDAAIPVADHGDLAGLIDHRPFQMPEGRHWPPSGRGAIDEQLHLVAVAECP